MGIARRSALPAVGLRRLRRTGLGAFPAISLAIAATIWVGHAPAVTAESKVDADFNGDGRADLAVGVMREDLGEETLAGAVNVIYGAPGGLAATTQFWTQDSPGIEGVAEGGDQFGAALAAGDFDGDGYDDLAIGVPSESVGSTSHAGAINVLYGSASGLTAAGNQIWTQDTEGVLGVVEFLDRFGVPLAADDFDGDGRDDLAVGVPDESVGNRGSAGAVHILYGSSSGLTAQGNQIWTQDSAGIADEAGSGDRFGATLAAGDFDGSGRADLAIGVPDESVGGDDLENRYRGAVHVLRGSVDGLTATASQFWTLDSPGMLGDAHSATSFGMALAVGDFDQSGQDDLAIGSNWEMSAGSVRVLYGLPLFGLTSIGNQMWSQQTAGIEGVAEAFDRFGSILSAGDFDGNGVDDLAVSVPEEDIGSLENAGAVNVIYGVAGSGLSALNNELWIQDDTGAGVSEANDYFGRGLSVGDFDGDGRDDLAIGVFGEDVGSIVDAGAVNILYGLPLFGLTSIGAQIWTQSAPGPGLETAGTAEEGDTFGATLPR